MTARDRRALVLGLTVTLAALVVLRGIPWAARRQSGLRTRAVEAGAAAQRARDVLAVAATRRDSLGTALAAVVALAPRLIDGHTSAGAGASLASLVTLAASEHRLRVVRLDPQPDSSGGVFAQVRVHAELEGDVRGLVGFLRALDAGPPVLAVPALAVLAPAPPGSGAEALRIEATITGRYLPRGTK
jgi:hypothetical protein